MPCLIFYGVGTMIGAGFYALLGKVAGESGMLALFLPLVTLAKITSSVILLVFAMVNLALWRVKRFNPDKNGAWTPFWI